MDEQFSINSSNKLSQDQIRCYCNNNINIKNSEIKRSYEWGILIYKYTCPHCREPIFAKSVSTYAFDEHLRVNEKLLVYNLISSINRRQFLSESD